MNNTNNTAAVALAFYRSPACTDALRAGKRVKVTAASRDGFVAVVPMGTTDPAFRVVLLDANRQPVRTRRPGRVDAYTSIEAAVSAARAVLVSYVAA